MKPLLLILGPLGSLLLNPAAGAQSEPVKLIADSGGETEVPYGEQRTLEFICPWDPVKTPTVLDFQACIHTPGKPKLTGGPALLLTIELNGEPLDGSRLLNKPIKSERKCPSACVWYERPKWGLMYSGSWDPPPNDYTPNIGSPTRFVLEVGDLLKAGEKAKLVLVYCDSMASDEQNDNEKVTLAEYCRRRGQGNATLLFADMVIRPKKDTDVPPNE